MYGISCFTDGVGTCSSDVVAACARASGEDNICAIEIRIGGAKGVIFVDPELEKETVRLSRSMVKFQSKNEDINLIKVSFEDNV